MFIKEQVFLIIFEVLHLLYLFFLNFFLTLFCFMKILNCLMSLLLFSKMDYQYNSNTHNTKKMHQRSSKLLYVWLLDYEQPCDLLHIWSILLNDNSCKSNFRQYHDTTRIKIQKNVQHSSLSKTTKFYELLNPANEDSQVWDKQQNLLFNYQSFILPYKIYKNGVSNIKSYYSCSDNC